MSKRAAQQQEHVYAALRMARKKLLLFSTASAHTLSHPAVTVTIPGKKTGTLQSPFPVPC